MVEHVFDRLKGQFGAKLADMWAPVLNAAPRPGEPLDVPNIVEREWMESLAGFQRHELERGCDACSNRIFPPTLGEFKMLCRPCLDPEWAWHEAQECLVQREAGQMGEWTHPAVFFAALKMGPAVRGGDWSRHRKAWTRVLQGEISRGWRTIPPAPQKLPEPVFEPVPAPETAKAMVERMRREDAEKALARTLREQEGDAS